MPFLYARDAGKQNAAAAGNGSLQQVSAHLDRHAAGDLAHAGKKRQGSVRELHGLIGDADDLLFQQGFGLLGIGRKVQIGEQDLAFVEEVVFGRQRFLDLDDHLGRIEDFLRSIQKLRAVRGVFLIREAASESRAFLNEYAVAGFHERIDHRRGYADTAFLGLDLCGAANNHDKSSLLSENCFYELLRCPQHSTKKFKNKAIFGLR